MSILGILGGAAGYALGGMPGATLGAQIGGGIDANQARADAAASANEFSAQQYSTRYQTQVKDLEAAGLNPMLAYMQSPGSSPTGVSYQPQNAFEGASRAYHDTRTADPAAERDVASAGESRARTSLAERTAERTVQEIVNLKTDNEKTNAVIRNLGEEFQNLMKQGWNLTEVGNQLRESVSFMRKQGDQSISQRLLNDAITLVEKERKRLVGAQAGSAEQDERAGAAFGELGKTTGQLRPFLELLWNALIRHR